jgi:hypothetical protein
MGNDLTVCITTTGRPHFLRSALQSVANQINRDLLTEVIVSENKGDPRSAKVAAEFPELPIRFLFRDPPLPMLAHLFSTFRAARGGYVAILNDDDWWCSNHIADAIAALSANKAASGYVSAALFTKDEPDDHPAWIDRSAAVWLLAGMPSWLKLWTLAPEHILALDWLYTPFHWSTLVAPSSVLNDAMRVLETETYHTHTIDRLVFNQLALRGPLCYQPIADTYVRWHSGNWAKAKDKKEIEAVMQSTIRATEQLAREQGWNVRDIWTAALKKMPREIQGELLYRFGLGHTKEQIREYGFDRFFQDTPPPRRRLRALRNMAANAKHFVLGE